MWQRGSGQTQKDKRYMISLRCVSSKIVHVAEVERRIVSQRLRRAERWEVRRAWPTGLELQLHRRNECPCCVAQGSHCGSVPVTFPLLDTIPNRPSSKEQRFLAHGCGLWLAGSRAETRWQRGWWAKSDSYQAAKKLREKVVEPRRDTPSRPRPLLTSPAPTPAMDS